MQSDEIERERALFLSYGRYQCEIILYNKNFLRIVQTDVIIHENIIWKVTWRVLYIFAFRILVGY